MKAAQQADVHEMLVTGTVWDWAQGNDYLAVTCPCGNEGPSPSLWHDVTLERVPEDDGEREGKLLTSQWCEEHGAEYCAAVLSGLTHREDAHEIVEKASAVEHSKPVRAVAARKRRDHLNLMRGLSRR